MSGPDIEKHNDDDDDDDGTNYDDDDDGDGDDGDDDVGDVWINYNILAEAPPSTAAFP